MAERRFFSKVNIIAFLFCNISVYLILIFLQLLLYGFSTSINLNIGHSEQKKAAIQFVLENDALLIAEALAGLFVLYWINKKIIFEGDRKRSFFVILFIFIMLLSSMIYFSFDYVGKFSGK